MADNFWTKIANSDLCVRLVPKCLLRPVTTAGLCIQKVRAGGRSENLGGGAWRHEVMRSLIRILPQKWGAHPQPIGPSGSVRPVSKVYYF
jgi:hypothetical protein